MSATTTVKLGDRTFILDKTKAEEAFAAKKVINGRDTMFFNILPLKYQWAYDLYKTMKNNHWEPEDIQMQKDCEHWRDTTGFISDVDRWIIKMAIGYFSAAEGIAVELSARASLGGLSGSQQSRVLSLNPEHVTASDVRSALDAWTGVGLRAGHPLVADAWSARARAIALAARLPKPPAIPLAAQGKARGAHNSLLRTMARGDNEDHVRRLSEALQEAPWYADAYRWRAAARAMAVQRDDAMRDLICYALAARDSEAIALTDRALRALAVRDTITAYTLLK